MKRDDDNPFAELVLSVQGCRLCEASLPMGPRPVFQIDPQARILIAGQAPGRRVHETGVPFDDPSGERLRDWLGVSRDLFYDATQIAILPMGFCCPGAGDFGDLPPHPGCGKGWHTQLMDRLDDTRLAIMIGQYPQNRHLPSAKRDRTETVQYRGAMAAVSYPGPAMISSRFYYSCERCRVFFLITEKAGTK